MADVHQSIGWHDHSRILRRPRENQSGNRRQAVYRYRKSFRYARLRRGDTQRFPHDSERVHQLGAGTAYRKQLHSGYVLFRIAGGYLGCSGRRSDCSEQQLWRKLHKFYGSRLPRLRQDAKRVYHLRGTYAVCSNQDAGIWQHILQCVGPEREKPCAVDRLHDQLYTGQQHIQRSKCKKRLNQSDRRYHQIRCVRRKAD